VRRVPADEALQATAGTRSLGTANGRSMLMDVPFVVVYRLSPLTYALGRPFVSVPHYAMPQLIAGARSVRMIQRDCTGRLASEVVALCEDAGAAGPGWRVRQALSSPGASAPGGKPSPPNSQTDRKKLDMERFLWCD